MPEGPELHLAARFVNEVCRGVLFSGKVVKSEVSKSPDVEWVTKTGYSISAVSRGKEMMLTLTDCSSDNGSKHSAIDCKLAASNKSTTMDILFRFGMSGRFRFDPVSEIHKHAHLKFYTKDGESVLSFVDYRRFGSWHPGATWGAERGPCILQEYDEFRKNVLSSLDQTVFNKPICEAMLVQKYFNGVGNYLRAEALYRAKIPPFVQARKVLENLPMKHEDIDSKTREPDVLELCNVLSSEVVNLSDKSGYGPDATDEESSTFMSWLQCYYQPDMQTMVDHNKRTIWFSGKAGPMAPKQAQIRHQKVKKKVTSKAAFESTISANKTSDAAAPKKAKKPRKPKGDVKEQATSDDLQLTNSTTKNSDDGQQPQRPRRMSKRKSLCQEQPAQEKMELPSPEKRKRTNAHDWPRSTRSRSLRSSKSKKR